MDLARTRRGGLGTPLCDEICDLSYKILYVNRSQDQTWSRQQACGVRSQELRVAHGSEELATARLSVVITVPATADG